MTHRSSLWAALAVGGALGFLWAAEEQPASGPVDKGSLPATTRPAEDYLDKHVIANGVQLTLRMRNKLRAGEPVEVELTIQNRSDRDVENGFDNWEDCDFIVKLLGDTGAPVAYTRYGNRRRPAERVSGAVAYQKVIIRPGESHSFIVNLGLMYDLTIGGRFTLEVQKLMDYTKPSRFELKLGGCEFYITDPAVRHRLPPKPAAASRPNK